MSDTLEVRIAHLEGAYEQVDKRLGAVESILWQLRSEINDLRNAIDRRIDNLTSRGDSQFHWLLGTILTTWVTMLLAIFFRP
ncbi:MAG: hypothetical protein HYX74_04275 [Acidobacteria bacterium]|nr:hypothetical protein [Acidobacteriota bacterium]